MATVASLLNAAAIPHSGLSKVYLVRNRLDFSKTPVANADVVQALSIPANTVVLKAFCNIVTAEGGALTAELGDGADANGWDVQVDLNAAAGTITAPSMALNEGAPNTYTDAYAPGKLYDAADTIDLTMGGAADAAIVDVYALCVDLNV